MIAIHAAAPHSSAQRVFAEPNLQCAAVDRGGDTDVLMLQYQASDRPVEDGRPLAFNELFAAVHANGDKATPSEVGALTLPSGAKVTGMTTMVDFVMGPEPAVKDAKFEIVGGELWYVAGQG